MPHDVFASAAVHAFARTAHAETYTPVGGVARSVQVIFERSTSIQDPDREARVVSDVTLAQLLVSEVGRPQRGAKLTDGEVQRTIGGIRSDDGYVVVVVVL